MIEFKIDGIVLNEVTEINFTEVKGKHYPIGEYKASGSYRMKTNRRFKGRAKEAYQRRCAHKVVQELLKIAR